MPIIYPSQTNPLADLNLTPNRVIITDANGNIVTSSTISTDEVKALENSSASNSIHDQFTSTSSRIDGIESNLGDRLDNIDNVQFQNMIVPKTAYWAVARIQLDDFDFEIDSAPSISSQFGIKVVNHGRRLYISATHTGGSAGSNAATLPAPKTLRTNIQTLGNAYLFGDIDLSDGGAILHAKMILSSYGSGSSYDSTLMVELDVTRHDGDNNLFIVKAYTVKSPS